MAFSPRNYNLVEAPQVDPLRSLSELMTIGRQVEQFNAEGKERARVQRVEKALTAGKGNPDAAAALLEKEGDWISARTLRDKSLEIRTTAVDGVMERLNQHKTIYGQGAQFLTEIEQRPDLYPQLRPKLVELATSLDPKLAESIPEAYDATTVKGMLDYVTIGAQHLDTKQRALALAKQTITETKDKAEAETAFTRVVGDWLSTAKSPDEWSAGKDHAAFIGVPKSIIDKFGEWDEKAPIRARELSMTPAERATDARAAADDKRADAAATSLQAYRNAQLGISRQREARLAAQERSSLSATGKATAERWKIDALNQLETEFTKSDSEMTTADLRRRQLMVENGYRAQLGLSALKTLPKEWTGTDGPSPDDPDAPEWVPPPSKRATAPTAPTAPAAPAAEAKAAEVPDHPMKGKTVELPDGSRITVTAVYADGTFDGDPVK